MMCALIIIYASMSCTLISLYIYMNFADDKELKPHVMPALSLIMFDWPFDWLMKQFLGVISALMKWIK